MDRTLRAIAIVSALVVFLAFSAPLTSTASPVASDGIDFAALEAHIQAQMDKHGLQGVSLGLWSRLRSRTALTRLAQGTSSPLRRI